jgi:predicted  nucleic acid-binding Zn-ribbon protein
MSTQIRGNKQIKNITIENDQLVNGTIELNKLKDGAELIKRDGSVAYTGNIDAGSNKLVNLGAPVNANDAVRKADLDAVAEQIGGTLINREMVSGVKDGENVTFTLANEPTLSTEQIFLNGSLLNAGANADYVIVGDTITFTVAPQSGDIILANYVVDAIQLNVDVQATLNQFNARLTTAEGELFDAQGDIVSLDSAIDALDVRVTASEADISALEVRATNIENNVDAVEADIAAEEVRAIAAEGVLDSRLTSAEFDIVSVTNRVTAAEGDINDLEAADVLMDGRVSDLEDGLQAETTARTTAVNGLNTRVTALETEDAAVDGRLDTLESDVSDLQSDLAAEAATRLTNDNTLQSNINTEIANRTAAVLAVQINLNTEIGDRAAAVLAEEIARSAADAAIETDLANEIIRATAAEAALSGRLDDIEADNLPDILGRLDVVEANTDQNTVDIGIELNRALAAESALSGRIDALEADPVSQAYVDQKIADLVNSAPAVLDTLKELSDALGGDENFATSVAADIAAVDGRVDDVVADLAQEAIDRAADVDAEETRAMTAESALDTRVTALETAPPPVSALNDLSDATISSPSNGQVLQYNGTEWVNGPAPSTFSGSYTDLTNKPDLSVYALDSDLSSVDARVEALEDNAFVTREVPSGDVDGTNDVFTLANTPVAGSEQVFVNGLLQAPGVGEDYTISGSTITFAEAPLTGWKIHVSYATGSYMVSPGGSSSGSGAEIYQDAQFTWSNGSTTRTITHNKGRFPDMVKVFVKKGDGWVEHYDHLVSGADYGWDTNSSSSTSNAHVIRLFNIDGASSILCRIRLYWFGATDVENGPSNGGWL